MVVIDIFINRQDMMQQHIIEDMTLDKNDWRSRIGIESQLATEGMTLDRKN